MIRTRNLIATSVKDVMQENFPDKHLALCHAYAIVGSNLAAIEFEKPFRPVGGKAVFDTGTTQLIYMTDKQAFANPSGGAYHCWIESEEVDDNERELVDLTFGNNRKFAQQCGVPWSGSPPPPFLWGKYKELALNCDLSQVQPGFGKMRVWVKETAAGNQWLASHVQQHESSYVYLTTQALKKFMSKTRQKLTATKRSALGVAAVEAEEVALFTMVEFNSAGGVALVEAGLPGTVGAAGLWEHLVASMSPLTAWLEWLPAATLV
jgi:hypothetical protein